MVQLFRFHVQSLSVGKYYNHQFLLSRSRRIDQLVAEFLSCVSMATKHNITRISPKNRSLACSRVSNNSSILKDWVSDKIAYEKLVPQNMRSVQRINSINILPIVLYKLLKFYCSITHLTAINRRRTSLVKT